MKSFTTRNGGRFGGEPRRDPLGWALHAHRALLARGRGRPPGFFGGGLLGFWVVGFVGCWACFFLGGARLACWAVGLLGCWAVGLLGCWVVHLSPCEPMSCWVFGPRPLGPSGLLDWISIGAIWIGGECPPLLAKGIYGCIVWQRPKGDGQRR